MNASEAIEDAIGHLVHALFFLRGGALADNGVAGVARAGIEEALRRLGATDAEILEGFKELRGLYK